MGTFTIAIFFLRITPGPGVLSLAGVGSAYGYRQGWAYGTGLFFGSNLVLIAAASGLAALFLADERIRLVFTVLSTAYLLYMAAKIAFSGSKITFIQATRPRPVGRYRAAGDQSEGLCCWHIRLFQLFHLARKSDN